jgi:glyoxylase-like metal-dependent hydrolase (beta-lactamase superfamily II)
MITSCFRAPISRNVFLLLMILVAGCAEMKGKVETAPQQAVKETEPKPAVSVSGGYLETAPPIPQKGYLLSKLAQDVYFFSTGTDNTMFVVTAEGVILVDPLGGKGALIKNAIAEITPLPVKFVIYSHSHEDRIGDAHLFAKGAQIIGQIETKKLLESSHDANRPAPNMAFGSAYALSIGGVKIELLYPGEGHGKGNIMIHVPGRKVLMYADVATPKSVPPKSFSTTNIDGQIAGIQSAMKLDFTVYVAGHLHRPGKKEEMVEVLQYYNATKNANKEAMKRVTYRDISAKTKSKDPARITAEYHQAVAEECYQILKKDWKPQLMGFEVFARSHCDVWTTYHRNISAP